MNNIDETVAQSPVSLDLATLSKDSSRKAFLAKLGLGAVAATALTTGSTSVFAAGKMLKSTAAIPATDAHILNFALTLEHLESAFYQRAARAYPGGSYMSQVVRKLRFDEEEHVNALTAAIKSFGYTPAAAAPRYNLPAVFNNRKKFLTFAAVLEDTGVHAYLGQAPNIKTGAILLTAASIVTVEARHAGVLRGMLHHDPTDGPFDKGLTEAQVLGIAGPLIGK